MASAKDEERYLADVAPRVAGLEVSESFKALSQSEKLYAYWLSRASWAGGRIIMKQWTYVLHALWHARAELCNAWFQAQRRVALRLPHCPVYGSCHAPEACRS